MQITLSFDTFTELPYTSGTVQNISSQATVEICQNDTANSGLILGPGEWFSWSNSTIYARSAWDYEPTARCAVVPFLKQAEGGGEYILPVATKTTLGGVKIGAGLSVTAGGTLSATGGGMSIDEWTAGNTYKAGAFVTYQNLLYKCITANSDTTWTPANWQKIGDVNFTGATSSANGTNGLVPEPSSNQTNCYLRGDGSWALISSLVFAQRAKLWSGTHLTFNNMVTLNDGITNYDVIIFNAGNGEGSCVVMIDAKDTYTFAVEVYSDNAALKVQLGAYCLASSDNIIHPIVKNLGTQFSSSNPCNIDIYGIKFVTP